MHPDLTFHHRTSRDATLVDILRRRAAVHPERVVYTWLEDGERETASRTFSDLDRRARAVAVELRQRTEPGDRVLLLFREGLAFADAFFGCLYAGVVPVPAAPDYVRRAAALARLEPIVRDVEPAIVLADQVYVGMISAIAHEQSAALHAIPTLDVATVPSDESDFWVPTRPEVDALALLQYTSGSTGTPKGVMVSHRNLTSNLEMSQCHLPASEESVFVSWLPMFHDMGLIFVLLLGVYCGATSVLMSPISFIRDPRTWLGAMTRYRGTVAGGPNFAFDQCVRRIPAADREGLDLRSWRRAFCGAETVRAETLDRFFRAYEPYGLDFRALDPGYGLAEATVMVCATALEGPRTVTLEARALEENAVRFIPPDHPGARRVVSVGPPPMEEEIRIVDPDTFQPLGEDAIGEVWVSGPNVALGYWKRPHETTEVFAARIAGNEDTRYLRTGDLGFMHDGELYVTGRLKELVIVNGRNHYPQDIELTAEQSHPGARAGCSAAFSIEDESEERLVIVQAIRPEYVGREQEILVAVRRAVATEHAITLHDLVFVPSGRIRKTTSGKIMRRAMRQDYLAGKLPSSGLPRPAPSGSSERAAQ